MDAAEFESDTILKMMTDALRRGPGSPEWHTAIEQLRTDGIPGADEYRLLLIVRERLESGRTYREVRAGPDFTRELMEKIDAESVVPKRTWRIAPLVAVLCLILLVIGGVLIGQKMLIATNQNDQAIRALSDKVFVTTVQSFDATQSIPTSLTSSGTVSLIAKNGIKVAEEPEFKTVGGTVLWSALPVDISNGICVESKVLSRSNAEQQIMQICILSDIHFTGALQTTGNELAVQMDRGRVSVVGGDATPANQKIIDGLATIRIKINGSVAVVECNNQTIYTGAYNLGSQPKYVGIRFVQRGKVSGDLRLESLSILAP